jgi:hypothetical protein
MLAKKSEMLDSSDLQRYSELVQKGLFYEYMETEIARITGTGYASRKRIKATIFQVLFTDNRFIGQEEAYPKRIFKELFPTVYEVFSLVKRNDKTDLPRLLQRIESHIVLLIITKRIAQERRGLPIFTIHDSIVTTTGNEGYVQNVMAEEMEKAIGIAPQLSIEHWNPENLRFNDGTSFFDRAKIAA